MTTVVTAEVNILLYQPEPLITDNYPLGEFRGKKIAYGDASGGYFVIQFIPPSLEISRQFIWLWMSATLLYDNAAAVDSGTFAVYRLDTQENNNMQFQSGAVFLGGASYNLRGGDYMNDPNMVKLRVPHRPDQTALVANSFNLVSSVNTNGAGYIGSVWGFIYHPEIRTRAGGFRGLFPT